MTGCSIQSFAAYFLLAPRRCRVSLIEGFSNALSRLGGKITAQIPQGLFGSCAVLYFAFKFRNGVLNAMSLTLLVRRLEGPDNFATTHASVVPFTYSSSI